MHAWSGEKHGAKNGNALGSPYARVERRMDDGCRCFRRLVALCTRGAAGLLRYGIPDFKGRPMHAWSGAAEILSATPAGRSPYARVERRRSPPAVRTANSVALCTRGAASYLVVIP